MQIKKINLLKDQRIFIEYSEPCGDSSIDASMKSPEKAQPEFYAAIENLTRDGVEMCELPQDDAWKACTIDFSYHGDENTLGAKITIRKPLNKSAKSLTVTSPLKYAEEISEPADSELLPGKCEEKLYTLIGETKLYIKGKREQTQTGI